MSKTRPKVEPDERPRYVIFVHTSTPDPCAKCGKPIKQWGEVRFGWSYGNQVFHENCGEENWKRSI